jgi:hypothetical protein
MGNRSQEKLWLARLIGLNLYQEVNDDVGYDPPGVKA